MTFAEILRLPVRILARNRLLVLLVLLAIGAASIYPSDMEGRYAQSRGGHEMRHVTLTEDYGRFINTGLQLAVPLLLRDMAGLKQLAVITVAGIVASHGPKRLLNDVEIRGTRLGQRPSSPDTRHNMPSGHATLAASGAYFLMRRYSLWFGLIVLPVLLATMYARVMLDEHTISAVIAGALTGMLVTALFTTRWRRNRDQGARR
ncbi:MAG: lipid A 1-phosphatase LpxE [Pararhodobacter sp.]